MNPYVQASLEPQLDELRRQTEQLSRRTEQGDSLALVAYGGSRQALSAELTRSMLANMANVGAGRYSQAYQQARQQFNTEEQMAQQAQNLADQFGLQALANQVRAGQIRRGIEQEGITADRLQFEEKLGLSVQTGAVHAVSPAGASGAAQSYSYAQPSQLS